ncbi:MAG: Zn-ribbon domain-containing OB-fold protein [Actinomycetota bacterium]
MPKARVPAVDGWFTTDGEPALLGTRCEACGTSFFPREDSFCRNPSCNSTDLREVELSRRGRVWSSTVNRYAPPPPFEATAPFEPFAVAAVELADERMIVLGQVAGPAEVLPVGTEVELVVEPLSEDAERELLVWKWKALA